MLLIAGLLVSIFLGITAQSTTVNAVDPAQWKSQNLVYDGATYVRQTDAAKLKGMGLSEGAVVYSNDSGSTVKAIIFPSLSELSDADSANLIEYDFTPPDTYTKKGEGTIQTDKASSTPDALASINSCNVDGIGFFVCPITTWLAQGMDWIYSGISGFLETQPLNITDRTSGMYLVWNIVLGIANTIFVIMFMVIIYSQITSFGISNYGIKKMLPRLIIAAVLINVSFYMCAAAIDLSNIAGQGLQDIFINVRNTTINAGSGSNVGIMNWESVAGLAMAGGAAAGAAGASFLLTFGGVTSASLFMILPLMLGFFVALLVVLLVLAARQALIVLLVIVSPLAFAAYLLPGTEKWFDKWKDLFLTMLIFFPAFSAVFGGAQLAAAVIIQNANSFVMVILGLAVQVAPLAIAPLILKLSGGLLNRFAGIVNNPTKGAVDKTRAWAEKKSKERTYERSFGNKDLKKNQIFRRAGRGLYQRGRGLDDRIAKAELKAENAYKESKHFAKVDIARRDAETDKSRIEKSLDNTWNQSVLSDTKRSDSVLRAKTAAEIADASTKRVDARFEDFRTGEHVAAGEMATVQQNAINAQDDAFMTQQRISMAQADQQQRIATRLRDNVLETLDDNNNVISYRDYSGGVLGASGATAALANAIALRDKAHHEGITEASTVQSYYKLTGNERQALTRGESVTIDDARGSFTFNADDESVVEAAALRQIEIGTYDQKMTVIQSTNLANLTDVSGEEITGATYAMRSAVSDAAARSGIVKTAVFLGGRTLEEITQGNMTVESAIINTIADGKVKSGDLSSNDFKALLQMFQFDRRNVPADKLANFDEGMLNLKYMANDILNSSELRSNASEAAIKVFVDYAIPRP